uniref:MSP domain-containing protein n=1 Tax=Panagrellus redivivus TaxID=6233 RepID=A0A7E4VWD2_PANRE
MSQRNLSSIFGFCKFQKCKNTHSKRSGLRSWRLLVRKFVPYYDTTYFEDIPAVSGAVKNWIAFAIKSNGIPRLTANPPSGILKPGEKHMIAVTVQGMEARRRKNIKVVYNP